MSRCTVLEAGGAGVTLDTCTGTTVEQSRVRCRRNSDKLWALGITQRGQLSRSRCATLATFAVYGGTAPTTRVHGRRFLNHIHHCGCGGEECLCDGGGLDGASYNARQPIFLRQNYVHHIRRVILRRGCTTMSAQQQCRSSRMSCTRAATSHLLECQPGGLHRSRATRSQPVTGPL